MPDRGRYRLDDERRRQPPRVIAADADDVVALVHALPDRPEIAGGGELAVDDDQHVPGEPFNLGQDVGGDDDGLPFVAEPSDQRDQAGSLHRVGAVQRLVEQQHPRVVDERGGDLDPLPHPLRIAADRPIGRAGHIDQGDAALGGELGMRHLLQDRVEANELPAG